VLTVLTWQWGAYPMTHVARLRSMVNRYLSQPHRMVCITDRPGDVPEGVIGMRTPPLQPGDYLCTRRLWHFSPEAETLGPRVVHFDLDVVIAGPLDPLLDRDEPLVLWRCESKRVHGWAYNPTVTLFTPGTRTDLWDRYVADPIGLLRAADADGWCARNSDQAILTYLLQHEPQPHWTEADGVVSYRLLTHRRQEGELPVHARVVSFHGKHDPSDPRVQARSPWIARYWQ
jgi:hypothetical protein